MASGASKRERAAARAAERARAEQERTERRRRERRRTGLRVAAVVVMLALVVTVAVLAAGRLRPHLDLDHLVAAGKSPYGLSVGSPSAPHTIIVYEDFLCPFCGQLEKASHTRFAALAADGDALVDYRPVQFLGDGSADDYNVRATSAFATVLTTSGTQVAERYHDLLFAHQPDEGGPYPSDDDLVDLAVEAGADESVVRQPIEDTAELEWVRKATAQAKAVDLAHTPTVIVDGKEQSISGSFDSFVSGLVARLS